MNKNKNKESKIPHPSLGVVFFLDFIRTDC